LTGGIVSGGGEFIALPTVPELDYSIPPAPTSLVAAGAFTTVTLSWDFAGNPTCYFEIWRANVDLLGSAILLGTTRATVYSDSPGVSTDYYYWVRAISNGGTAGPYNDTDGTLGSTADDPSVLIDLMTQQPWAASTFVRQYYAVSPSTPVYDTNGVRLAYQATNSGTTGGTEPTWPTAIDDTVVDNGVTWIAIEAGRVPFMIGTVDGRTVTAISDAVIQDAAITSAKIKNLAVDNGHIANLAVTAAKIANATITGAKIASATITDANIASATITGAKIGLATITQANVASAAIGTAQIIDANISTLKVAGNAITAATSFEIVSDTTIWNASLSGTTGYVTVASSTIDLGQSGANPSSVLAITKQLKLKLWQHASAYTYLTVGFTGIVQIGSTTVATINFDNTDVIGIFSGAYYGEIASRDSVIIDTTSTSGITGTQNVYLKVACTYWNSSGGPWCTVKAAAGFFSYLHGAKR